MSARFPKAHRCPWCGKHPDVRPFLHLGKPRAHEVQCENQRCKANPGVRGRTRAEAVHRWNDHAVYLD